MDIFKLFKSQMPVSEKNRRLYNNGDVYKHLFHSDIPYAHVAFFDCIATIKITLHLFNFKLEKLIHSIEKTDQTNGRKRKAPTDTSLLPAPKRASTFCQCQKTNCSSCVCVKANRECTSKCRYQCELCKNPKGHKDRNTTTESFVSQDTSQTQKE